MAVIRAALPALQLLPFVHPPDGDFWKVSSMKECQLLTG